MYCTLDDIRQYLGIVNTQDSDDSLITTLIQAAHQRINDYTKRNFEATSDTTRYFDAIHDVEGNTLWLDTDLCNVTSISNDGTALPAAEYVTNPRNDTPWSSLQIKSTSGYSWTYSTAHENALSVTGRWACMLRRKFTAISRASGDITAAMEDTAGLVAGATCYVVGVADTTFNGSFTIKSVTASAITYKQAGANDTDTTGYVLFVPASIRQACIRLTAWLYRHKDNQSGDTDRPILAGDGNIIMPSTLPADVRMLLHEWVKLT